MHILAEANAYVVMVIVRTYSKPKSPLLYFTVFPELPACEWDCAVLHSALSAPGETMRYLGALLNALASSLREQGRRDGQPRERWKWRDAPSVSDCRVGSTGGGQDGHCPALPPRWLQRDTGARAEPQGAPVSSGAQRTCAWPADHRLPSHHQLSWKHSPGTEYILNDIILHS